MLTLQAEYQHLNEEAKFRLSSFYRRYCQGENGRVYGLGHLLYACHAAFPLVVSPELANLTWLNFKNYHYLNGKDTGQCHLVAVSDFLLSPICRKLGHQRYEVYPEIRSFLLLLLQDGQWFAGYGIKTEGKTRLDELAVFLNQFLAQHPPDNKFDGVGFQQLNEWAIASWTDPQLLARELAQGFKNSSDNNNEDAQLWLTLQMDKVGLQYGFNITNTDNRNMLSPFYRLYYYGKAREKQLYNQPAEAIYQYAEEISNFIDTGDVKNELVVKLPLLKSVAERTDRKINKVQRVLSLLIGVDSNPRRFPNAFVSTYGISKLASVLFHQNANPGFDTSHVNELTSGLATRQAVLVAVKTLVALANPEDICFLYFAGFSREEPTGNDRLFVYPDNMSKLPQDYVDTNEILEIVHSVQKAGQPQFVFLRDANETPYSIGLGTNNIMIGSVRPPEERHYDKANEENNSSFNDALITVLRNMNCQVTYRDLASWMEFTIMGEYQLAQSHIVLKAGPKNLDHYFLTNTAAPANKAVLMAYSQLNSNWQVMPNDFVQLAVNQPAWPIDYISRQAITSTAGEIYFDTSAQNYFFSCAEMEGKDKDKLYKLTVRPPDLYRISGSPVSTVVESVLEKDLVERLLTEHQRHPMSLWSGIKDAGPELLAGSGIVPSLTELNYYWTDDRSSIHITGKEMGGFKMTIVYGQEKKFHYTGEPEQLMRRLNWFAQNYDFLNAVLPESNQALQVLVDYYWQDNNGNNFSQYQHQSLPVMKEGVYFDEGRVRFHLLGIQLTNSEELAVFYTAYFITGEFAIRPIPEANGILQPGEVKQSTHDITDLLTDMAERDSTMEYKILFSRKPIQLPIQYLL